MDVKELKDLREAKREEVCKSIEHELPYINLSPSVSTLDGVFTSKELRLIADKMDEIKEEIEKAS